MIGMAKLPPERTASLMADMRARHRADELKADPSSIPGMTGAELADVINTGTISTALLDEVLRS